MQLRFIISLTKLLALILMCLQIAKANAQESVNFWQKVSFGGSAGVGFGSGYTDISLAPGAIYQFNNYIAMGAGLHGTYVHQRDYYDAYIYGGALVTLFNPIPQVQLSAELEQLRVNLDVDERFTDRYRNSLNYSDRNFWNTALFFGAGYQMEHVTIGLRYNVLYNKRDLVYSDALMPFVRVYF
jgi:hypothetical protein